MANIGSGRDNIKKVFERQRRNYTNRSSGVFFARVRPQFDTILTFMNYWKEKNAIQSILMNLRVYDPAGKLVHFRSEDLDKMHYCLSLKEELNCDSFDGMVEIEFISAQNLRFTFPAVFALYRSGKAFGAVHTAGRIRNSDESYTSDGNFHEISSICVHNDNTVPFIFLFNGPQAGRVKEVDLRIIDPSSKVIAREKFDPDIDAPFSSRLLFLDEVFDFSKVKPPKNSSFVAVLPNCEIFPRTIVGSYKRKQDFFEVEHSAEMQFQEDYVDLSELPKGAIPSRLVVGKPLELDLDLAFQAMNDFESSVSLDLRRAKSGESLSSPIDSWEMVTGGPNFEVREFRPPPEDEVVCFDFVGGKIPNRIKTAATYRVRDAASDWSAPTATGGRSWNFPSKLNSWGPGILSDEMDTVIVLSNTPSLEAERVDRKGELKFFLDNGKLISKEIEVLAESARLVSAREVLGNEADGVKTFSWMFKSNGPGVNGFFLSFAKDGRICGHHSF